MDRTREFVELACAAGYRSPLAHTARELGLGKPPPLSAAGAFTRAAAATSAELHLTSLKIAKLTARACRARLVVAAATARRRRRRLARARRSSLARRPLLTAPSPPLPATLLVPVARRRGMFDGDGGASSSEIDALTASIKADVTRLGGTLDALQGVVDARRAEAARAGARPGLPLTTPVGGGGVGGTGAAVAGRALLSSGSVAVAGVGGRGGAPPPPPPADVTSSVQGLAHSDAVLASLKGTLLRFGASLRGVVALRSEALRAAAARRGHFGAAGARPARDLGRPLDVGGAGGAWAAAGGAGGADAAALEPAAQHGFTAVAVAPDAAGGAASGASAAAARRAAAYGGGGAFGSGGGGSGAAGGRAVAGSAPVVLHGAASPGPGGGARRGAADAFALVDQAQLAADPEAAYLDARASDVAHIEASVRELSGLFGRLAGLVAEQGEAVERIDGAADDAAARVDAGEAELRRAAERAASTRGLALRVLGVAVTFVVGFTLFVV